ncbi:uncharacterized protein DEA37_0010514, partial [Paragonimus westermani]
MFYEPFYNIDGTHRCKICGNHFDRSVLLKAHLLEHGNDRPFPCFTCNIRFTTKWNLMKHQKCRSHRVVQAKAAVIGLEKSAKSIPIKKRKIDWTWPTQIMCQLSHGTSKLLSKRAFCFKSRCASLHHAKIVDTETIPLTVLSTSTSPIATQLHIKNGTGSTWDQIPTAGSTVKGMLTLELTTDQTVQIPVSVKHEDVQRCLHRLTTAVKYEASNASKSTVSDCTSNTELPTVKKLHKHSGIAEPCLSQPPEPHACTSMGVAAEFKYNKPLTCHSKLTPSPLTTSSSVINTRTHEELQAACTILSLANCGELPPPLLCPVSPPTLANCRPEPLSKTGLTSSIIDGSQVPLESGEFRRDRSPPTIDPVPLMTDQDPIPPKLIPPDSHSMVTTEVDPLHGEGSNRSRSAVRHTQHLKSNAVSRTLDSVEPGATQKHRAERMTTLTTGIVPNQPKVQPSIRPPPKKRLCEEYERSLAVLPTDIN